MTAFNEAFRSEIARIARKESKRDVEQLRKTVTAQRADIASLKRTAAELQRSLKKLLRMAPVVETKPVTDSGNTRRKPLSHEALVEKRDTLGLSIAQMATLLNVTPLSLRKWETGEVTPRKMHHDQIRIVLSMGKREARRILNDEAAGTE